MPDIWFYHLERTPIHQVLPDLLEKVTQKGWRAYVHGLDDDMIEGLNAQLWAYRSDSFLAHGLETEDMAERQPVLLGASGVMINRPDVYMSVSPLELPDVSALQRCLLVFEGSNDEHLVWARGQWKRMKADGCDLAYWKQNELGRWEKIQ